MLTVPNIRLHQTASLLHSYHTHAIATARASSSPHHKARALALARANRINLVQILRVLRAAEGGGLVKGLHHV